MAEEKLNISAMTFDDIKEVVKIEESVFPTPWTDVMFISEIRKKIGAYYIVVKKDKLIGYGGLNYYLDEAHITNLAVDPDYQGKGFGKLILIQLLHKTLELKIDLIWLEVRPSNYKAINLYEKFLFVNVGKRKKYYVEQGEDAIIYCHNSLESNFFINILEKEEKKLREIYAWGKDF